MPKYNVGDNHEWQDEQKEQSEYPKATLDSHTIQVILHHSEEYQDRTRYDCEIVHGLPNAPKVLSVTPCKDKGNYFRTMHDEWVDFHDVPMRVREKVAETLDTTVESLTLDERIVNPENNA